MRDSLRIAVLIPCHNEERTIGQVVVAYRRELPKANIYVYDNASTDGTARAAAAAGAIVRREPRIGKGHVVRRMFADVEADVYLIVDGDGTYDSTVARELVGALLNERADMVIGTRCPSPGDTAAYRKGHKTGNAAFNRALSAALGSTFTDIFSGYRALSRRFVKSFPAHSTGFEIETELSAHAIDLSAPWIELPTAYGSREEGSFSKLRTYRDGTKILLTIVRLVESMRPLRFFTGWFLILTAIALALGIPVINEYTSTGLVPRFPTAILAASIELVAVLCLASGMILKSVQRVRREARRLAYLLHPPPPSHGM